MIRRWLEDREARKCKKQYDAGYGWAMSQYYVNGNSVEDIGCFCCGADPFDQGARAALMKINIIERALYELENYKEVSKMSRGKVGSAVHHK